MHLHTGEMKFNGTHGPVWMQNTLCNKLLKDERHVTKNRDRVTCPKCLRRMEQDEAFMRWMRTGKWEDFELAHAAIRGQR